MEHAPLIVTSKSSPLINFEILSHFETASEIPINFRNYFEFVSHSNRNQIYSEQPRVCIKLTSILDKHSSSYPKFNNILLKIVKICKEKGLYAHAMDDKDLEDLVLKTRDGNVRINRVAFKTHHKWCKAQISYDEGMCDFSHYSRYTILMLKFHIYEFKSVIRGDSLTDLFDLIILANMIPLYKLKIKYSREIVSKAEAVNEQNELVEFLNTLGDYRPHIGTKFWFQLFTKALNKNSHTDWFWDVLEPCIMSTGFKSFISEHAPILKDEIFRFAEKLIDVQNVKPIDLLRFHGILDHLLPTFKTKKRQFMVQSIEQKCRRLKIDYMSSYKSFKIKAKHLVIFDCDNPTVEIFKKFITSVVIADEDDKKQLIEAVFFQSERLSTIKKVSLKITKDFGRDEILQMAFLYPKIEFVVHLGTVTGFTRKSLNDIKNITVKSHW